jgi:hypothetical protein
MIPVPEAVVGSASGDFGPIDKLGLMAILQTALKGGDDVQVGGKMTCCAFRFVLLQVNLVFEYAVTIFRTSI